MVQISGLTSKAGAKKLRQDVLASNISQRGITLTTEIIRHFNSIHANELPIDYEIEKMILDDEFQALKNDMSNLKFVRGVVTFSPSSASKCERELYYKALKESKDHQAMFPYQRRWVRNGSAVHGATQKDLLYAEKYLENPAFTVVRTKTGRPAWEKNLRHVRQFEHNGVKFQIYGMMDGALIYTPDESKVGFEFKTKSTSIGAIGSYKMKDAQDSHKEQCIAYSLLFGLSEFLIVYESLAKDNWTKNEEAKPDMRAFYLEVTDLERELLLDKFAKVAKLYYARELPSNDTSKCLFCPYKSKCECDLTERSA